MIYKYVVKNAAAAAGKTATFMPKPIFEENGSGMHVHQSLWKDDEPLMYGPDGYAHLSDLAKHYIGGLLAHAPALLAFCAPTTNSYRRLVPGYEAPVNLVYSARNRSACVRVPMYHEAPKTKRVEFRSPGPDRQPVPRVQRADDGRPGRDQAPARPGRAARHRHLRAARRADREARDGAVVAGGERSTRSRPTTSSCCRATCSPPGLINAYVTLQARGRGRRDPDAAASVGVRAVPRRVAPRPTHRPGVLVGALTEDELGGGSQRLRVAADQQCGHDRLPPGLEVVADLVLRARSA